jgi:branched-chain amino acid aminotransferase
VRLHNVESDFLIYVTPFGAYLDIDKGARCCTSSWRRVEDTCIPARAKINGAYVNSALAKTEAVENGFDEAIMLNEDGHVSEGSGENIFIVENGRLITPAAHSNVLIGITRDTVMTLAREELGVRNIERPIDRSELYVADECFMTAPPPVTPVIDVDRRPVGEGSVGPITAEIMRLSSRSFAASTPSTPTGAPCYSPAEAGAKVKAGGAAGVTFDRLV